MIFSCCRCLNCHVKIYYNRYNSNLSGNTKIRKINSTKNQVQEIDKKRYISNSYLAALKSIDTEIFTASLSDFYSANGDRLDDGVIRLLHSGIKLSDSEIERLVEQNRTNPTMLRVIADHCEKNEIDNKAARLFSSYAKSAGSHEINAFNQVVDMIGRVTGTDETVAEVWSKEDSHFERLSNGAIANVAALSVHPAEN